MLVISPELHRGGRSCQTDINNANSAKLARHKIYITCTTSIELAYTFYILSDVLYISLMLKIA